ncbi:hypothetical protein PBV87_00750 [Niameybacter massiliensis]|uniref:Uncharacterized protein n=1 Tax=Holtiella tumoricola TaxID=3018743 RepID=A0AA42DJD4_9FIRM|nr:hypothetical protein [Holtiella tumoricola]MDA3730041.1 hypothetical protein [Holtiella tumoricola]
MAYSAEERETVIQTDDATEVWNVYTRQRKMINKLIKQGYEPFKVEKEGDNIVACEFSIPINKISFRNANAKVREYTEQQKEEMRQRLAQARATK